MLPATPTLKQLTMLPSAANTATHANDAFSCDIDVLLTINAALTAQSITCSYATSYLAENHTDAHMLAESAAS
jgi:hypothetical protein